MNFRDAWETGLAEDAPPRGPERAGAGEWEPWYRLVDSSAGEENTLRQRV